MDQEARLYVKKLELKCRVCKRVLSKRRALKLGRAIYCPTHYFGMMKQFQKEDPRRFEIEINALKKEGALKKHALDG